MLTKEKEHIDKIFTTNPIRGNFCELHHINQSDANLIYDLRLNRKDSYLKDTSGTVKDQENYIKKYLEEKFNKKEEIYYKILDLQQNKFSGVLRLTEIKGENNFNWQSFVVSETTSPNVPIDSMLIVYRIGFEFLNRQLCGPWVVDKTFEKMIKIHNFIKMAKITGEEGKYHLFSVKKPDYENNINRFIKMGYAKLGGLL